MRTPLIIVPEDGQAPRPRTRPPSRWTTAFLVVSGVMATWSIGLFVLTLLAITQPTLFYTDQKALIKALGATVIAALVAGQAFTMSAAMGLIPRLGIRMRYLLRAHRYGGRLAIGLAAVVAWFCMTDLGAPPSPLRDAIHAFFASTAFGAIAVKLALIRFRPTLAYDLAPWLGRYAALAFIVVWISSAVAFFTGRL